MSETPAWITFQRSTAIPRWGIVRFEYVGVDDPRNNSSTNIYVKCLDEHGTYITGATVYQAFPGETVPLKTRPPGSLDFNGEPFGVSIFLDGNGSSFDPGKGQVGPQSVLMDAPCDRVDGMGLPLRRHVQHLITFQRLIAPPAPGPTPPPPTPPQFSKWVIESQDDYNILLTREGP